LETVPSGTIVLPIPVATPLQISGGTLYVYSLPTASEPITVQAGSFVALSIHQDVLYDIIVTLPDGSQHNVLINMAVQQYFVEGVGLVQVDFMGGTVSATDGTISEVLASGGRLELVSYSIP
jgi:hypothetical protein